MMTSRLTTCLLLACLGTGCGPLIEHDRPNPQHDSGGSGLASINKIMRGTVGEATIMLGYDQQQSREYRPVIGRGYGLVVGLNGTGSGDIPPNVRSMMITEMARNGVGRASSQFPLTPEQMLDSEDTAIVIVEAVIPAASKGRIVPATALGGSGELVPGTTFDVRVTADPRTGTTSLEGGRLYTTQLRPGALTTQSRQASPLAVARGPIFINPFAEPGAVNRDAIDRLSGRILEGGEVLRDMPLKLVLEQPGHGRARSIESAINRRFPQEHGQREKTAHGRSDGVIDITVPPSWRNRTGEFVQVLRHTSVRQSNAEAIALSTKRAVRSDPGLAETAYWRWYALGNRSLPFVRDLYDDSEELPRLAALRAGAKLGDGLVIDQLQAMATSGSRSARLEAIDLLKDMPFHPTLRKTLRDLLNDEDVETRLRAYETMVHRGDPFIHRASIDGKFDLHHVPADRNMVYITQFGAPTITLFGDAIAVSDPILFRAWSNRLMIRSHDDETEGLEVFYRPDPASEAEIRTSPADLATFIDFLGHQPTIQQPREGLGLTYSQTVGALHQLWSQGFLKVDFKAQKDRVMAQIALLQDQPDYVQRPDADEGPVPTRPEVPAGDATPAQTIPGTVPR